MSLPRKNLLQHELPSLYGCDVLVLNDARAGVARVGKTVFPILEYNMESCSFLSALGLEDVATVLLYNPPGARCRRALYGYHSGF